MDDADDAGDDRTFKANFTGDGAVRLMDRVQEKLQEFIGDYTDATLAEYVIVLLRNGRRKDEARRELNVFLGKDSVPFISWLWDHLSSNLQLYVQPIESYPEKVAKISPKGELSGRHDILPENLGSNMPTDSEHETEKSTRSHRIRHNKGWKGLMPDTELFPLRRTMTEILHSEMRTHEYPDHVRLSGSPVPQVGSKRSREDEGKPMKTERASRPLFGAPRRLLQFAVRDAVRTVQQSSSVNERTPKRLRSVVSLSTADSMPDESSQRTRSVARVTGLSTVLKAAAEAAEDATKVKNVGSVFDRLGQTLERTEPISQSLDTREPALEDGEYEDFDQISGPNVEEYYQSRYDGESTMDASMLDRDVDITADSTSDNDGYDDVRLVRQHGRNVSQRAVSAKREKSSLRVQSSVAQNADVVRKTRLMDHIPPASAVTKESSKIVNISVNVNTWKPSNYQAASEVNQTESQRSMEKEGSAVKLKPPLQQENKSVLSQNQNEVARIDVQKESPKTTATTSVAGSYATTRPLDDVDSRTVFVSNVHFAATKDNLSRHFNKFGEVLKVIIITDAATGQPKGSAYVEFLRKESAELALQLNGTSFMSRILKVVRRSSVHHEAAAMYGWPRIARASPFASSLARMSFPRGAIGGALRARLPIKPGARSLQWKRGASASQTNEGMKGPQTASLNSGNPIPSPTGKNLTYVRTEPKSDGKTGAA